MEVKQLTEAILDGGLRSINFFNGRLLSGEDLSQEQTAWRESRRRLGQAIGTGIAFGLDVSEALGRSTRTAPVVTVTPGLGINRHGDTLALSTRVDVALARPVSPATPTPGLSPLFAACDMTSAGDYIAGTGVYLLTIAPAVGSEGRALVSGLGNTTAACNTRYLVEGLQFRLLQLDLTPEELQDQDRLRNRVAYKCFGIADTQPFQRDPFGPPLERYGLLDHLRPQRLTDREMPLALLHWTATNGMQFIDLWAVRRRITRTVTSTRWSLFVDDRRLSEAEAALYQFQDHIEGIRGRETNLDTLVATQRFEYLPPVGILPLQGIGATPGFQYQQFFAQQAYHDPLFIEGAYMEPLLRTALPYAPIHLPSKDPMRLYSVIDGTTTRPYLLFTSAYVPFPGEARFNVVRWNFSHFV